MLGNDHLRDIAKALSFEDVKLLRCECCHWVILVYLNNSIGLFAH